jgi:hypothetical protein
VTTIDHTSPCEATVIPDDNGGMTVRLFVPTYSGGMTFELTAERDAEPDPDSGWRVYLPAWPEEGAVADRGVTSVPWPSADEPDGFIEVANGIVYLGGPDVEVERKD